MEQEVSLYFHIPFCTRKCSYCHFYVLPDKEKSKDELLEGFTLEWKRRLPALRGKTISTIYFGGGTPFLFGPDRIQSVLNFVKQDMPLTSLDPEITLEANPENVTLSLMKEYRDAGINRISLGIQTLDARLLKVLGRLHQPDTALQAVHLTAEAGIKNISVDLMYDLPNQTLEDWEVTLQAVKDLPITHLSLYNLTIEPHTIFFKQREILAKLLPDEQTSLQMYQRAVQVMEAHGLAQYEISAFAKPGHHSRHNVGYWTARPFLGFGPSAFSYWEGKRFRNIAHLKKYCDLLKLNHFPVDFEEQLDTQATLRELLAIQMRLKSGVDLHIFGQRHGKLDEETWVVLSELEKEGFVERKENVVRLTNRGVLFYDTVASELI